VSADGLPSGTTSQPLLPSVTSAHPMRRSASLCSAERSTAHRRWQVTLRDRLGTPGEPPGRDELPSLYNRPSVASAMRPVSGASGSAPPSTAGPSASIVAWFAQFRCEKCGRIPLSLDAKFCAACGTNLAIKVPTEPQAQVQAAQAEAGKAVGSSQAGRSRPLEDQQKGVLHDRHHCDPDPSQRPERISKKGVVERRDRAALATLLEKRGYMPDGSKGQGRPPRQPNGKDWAARESQVALWLGSIKPRVPNKMM